MKTYSLEEVRATMEKIRKKAKEERLIKKKMEALKWVNQSELKCV